MRLWEIEELSDRANVRVKNLKSNAKSAADRARQIATVADISADRLENQKARHKRAKLQQSATVRVIKPIGPA